MNWLSFLLAWFAISIFTLGSYAIVVWLRKSRESALFEGIYKEIDNDEIPDYRGQIMQNPIPIVYGCCGCSCHICANEHSEGLHTEECQERLINERLQEEEKDNG